MDIEGKVALVTGGANGIGLAYVKYLLKEGAKHVSMLDIQYEQGKNSAESLNQQFGKDKVMFIKCDVTNTEEFHNAFKTTISKFNSLDIVINNAGVVQEKNFKLGIAVNLGAVVEGTQLAMKYMGKQNGGHGGVVVNVASVLGLRMMGGVPVYVATKHAVIAYSRSMSTPEYFKETGVRIVVMCPGFTETSIVVVPQSNVPEPIYHEIMTKDSVNFTFQKIDPVAENMMKMIQSAPHGSIWVSESDQPAYQVEILDAKILHNN